VALTAAGNSISPDASVSRVAYAPVSPRSSNQASEQPTVGLSAWQCYLLAGQPS
jgi:hypothetical protein